MLNSNVNYPYPLLRATAEDFQKTVFNSQIEVLRESKGFRVVPHFSVNSEQVNSLIEDRTFSYAVQVQCRSTYYRTVEYIADNKPFFIPGGQVHEMVELCPCIIAVKDLERYYIDDFVPAFKVTPVSVYQGDVVGVGDAIRFHAYYKADEVKKASSVIRIQSDDTIERIKVNLNQPDIIVSLPKLQYDSYINAGLSTTDQVTLLTGIVSVPVISYALGMINDDDENDFSEKPWYKSLRALLDRVAGGDPGKVQKLLEDPISTATMLLGDNMAASLKILDDREW